MFYFLVTNLELLTSSNKFNIFLMFQCLNYSITFNKSKEKFRIIFCCFSAIKNFDTALSSSSFPIKLVD